MMRTRFFLILLVILVTLISAVAPCGKCYETYTDDKGVRRQREVSCQGGEPHPKQGRDKRAPKPG